MVLVEEWSEGGDLLQAMCRAGGRLSERAAVQCVLKPLLSALEHLHTQVCAGHILICDNKVTYGCDTA